MPPPPGPEPPPGSALDAVLDALVTATGGHAAGAGGAVAGVPASWVAAPGSTAEASEVMRVASRHGLGVVVRGGSSTVDWGVPPERVDLIVDTRRLDRVIEHSAGDLVVVVQAGVRLADLAERLAEAGQQLALDQPLPGSTVGGTVATATSGPRRLLYGTVRDLVLGATLVRADGVVAKSGGKVVKNVAGYDLAKLVTGARGTLGMLTEAAFRLHPLPPAHAYVSTTVDGPVAAHRLVQRVLHSQLVPAAIELDQPAGATGARVTVLVEGTPAGAAGRARDAAGLLGADARQLSAPPDGWGRYPLPAGGTLVKLTCAVGRLTELLDGVPRMSSRGGVPVALRGSPGVGVFYAGLPPEAQPASVATFVSGLRAAAPAFAGSVVVLTAPAAVRAVVDLWGPVPGIALMRRVKEQFDPDRRLAAGRFAGGI